MLSRKYSNKRAFTLVEIMIVVAIIALLAAIAVPGFLRARKRAQGSRIMNDLRLIEPCSNLQSVHSFVPRPPQSYCRGVRSGGRGGITQSCALALGLELRLEPLRVTRPASRTAFESPECPS